MKLSEIVIKIQKFVEVSGDKDINSIDVIQESSVFSANRIGDFEIIEEEDKAVIIFDREEITRYTVVE